jgi:hypothetical protein
MLMKRWESVRRRRWETTRISLGADRASQSFAPLKGGCKWARGPGIYGLTAAWPGVSGARFFSYPPTDLELSPYKIVPNGTVQQISGLGWSAERVLSASGLCFGGRPAARFQRARAAQ